MLQLPTLSPLALAKTDDDSLDAVAVPKTIERKFELKAYAVRENIERLADDLIHVRSIGQNRWEICDPDLVEHQFGGPGIIATLKSGKTSSTLKLSLRSWMLPQTVKRQWAWNLGTSTALSLAVGLTAPAIAVWIVATTFLTVLALMLLGGLWHAKTREVLSLGDLASEIMAPIADRERRPLASATPYRCLNSELKAQAKRMRRAGKRRFRLVLPWSS